MVTAEETVAAGTVPELPARAEGVDLAGELRDSGFAEPQWLVQRDGDFLQLTELLYRVLEHANGQRTLAEIAAAVTESSDWLVAAEHVEHVIDAKLIPLGLIASASASPGGEDRLVTERTRSPLDVNLRVKALSPRLIEPVTSLFQHLFAPPLLVVALALSALAHAWLYGVRGLMGALVDAIYTPGFLVIVLATMFIAGIFHEFGHASALRYGGGRVRGMGLGFYLLFPVLFTDVTDSYRLGRWSRVRTGLGGIYFHAIAAALLIGVSWVTGLEFLLVAVLLINVEMVRQLIPLVRLDGYWVLADLIGIPDFISQAGPFVRSLFPGRGTPGQKLPRLKPWAKAVFTTYLLVAVPALALLLSLLLWRLPRLLTILWDGTLTQARLAANAVRAGDLLDVATASSQLLILALSTVGIVYLLLSLVVRVLRALLRHPKPAFRVGALALLSGAAVSLAFLWAPQLPFASGTEPAGTERFAVRGARHVTGKVSYGQVPPVGGDHAPVWQNCGFYREAIPSEQGVHSLEHGAVWITYRPDLPGAEIERLRGLAGRYTHLLVSPWPGLSQAIVASSWGRQVRLMSALDARLERFLRAFRLSDRAPEPGGPCTNGLGKPE